MTAFLLFSLMSTFFLLGAYNSASFHMVKTNERRGYSRRTAPTPLGYLYGLMYWGPARDLERQTISCPEEITKTKVKRFVFAFTNITALLALVVVLMTAGSDGQTSVYSKQLAVSYLIGLISYWGAWSAIPLVQKSRSWFASIRQRFVSWWNESDRALLRWTHARAKELSNKIKGMEEVTWLSAEVDKLTKAAIPRLVETKKRLAKSGADISEVQAEIEYCLQQLSQSDVDIELYLWARDRCTALCSIIEGFRWTSERDRIKEVANDMFPSLLEQRFKLQKGLDAVEKLLQRYGQATSSGEFDLRLMTETAKSKGILSVQYDAVEDQIDHCRKFLDHIEATLHAAALADAEPVEVDAFVDQLSRDIRTTEECTRRAVAETSAATARARMQIVG